MKLKNFLIESVYWLGMFVALWLTVHSCAAQAQIPILQLVTERIGASGDSVVYARAIGVDLVNSPNDSIAKFGWITDSIKWVAMDTTFEGNRECAHEWVLDAKKPGSIDIHFTFGFEIMDCIRLNPDGKHCNEHQSATREKICRNCLRSVIEREKWFQRFIAPPKSEFEQLKEKQRAKQ